MSNLKRMDHKLSRIQAGNYRPQDFIIADAKDGDMAFGVTTPGAELDADGNATGRFKPLAAYRDDMQRVIASNLVDIMLTSLSSAEYLKHKGTYADSDVTPAVRLNDTSDIWVGRGANYMHLPAAPFRTARLDRVKRVADLGLYAISFYNDLDVDHRTLEAYAEFRDQASELGVHHFLEVFNPQFEISTPSAEHWQYNNDAITRCLAGVSRLDRPIFLKVPYNGPRATEELASFDPQNLIVGILGGAAGTTRDCLELLKQAEHYGARVALFGRKIYFADDSVIMLRAMRRVIEEAISSEEGTRAYHDELQKAGVRPRRSLAEDLQLTDPILNNIN